MTASVSDLDLLFQSGVPRHFIGLRFRTGDLTTEAVLEAVTDAGSVSSALGPAGWR